MRASIILISMARKKRNLTTLWEDLEIRRQHREAQYRATVNRHLLSGKREERTSALQTRGEIEGMEYCLEKLAEYISSEEKN